MYAGSSQVPQMRQSIYDAAPKGQKDIVRILLRAIKPVEKAATTKVELVFDTLKE
jgi:hypothetical protein